MGTVKFISLTYSLKDIIPIISALNLFFQKENLDVALVKIKIDQCVQDLQKLKDEPGAHMLELNGLLDKTTQPSPSYCTHHITGCRENEISSPIRKFIDNLITNINTRFPDTELIVAFAVLAMRPLSVLSQDELLVWGDDQLNVLLAHYGVEKTKEWVEEREKKEKTSPPIVNLEESKKEWGILKRVVLAEMYPRDDMATLWGLIAKYHQGEFPNLILLATLGITLPVHTSGVERGFSAQNVILTSLRNRLSVETQDMLLRVKCSGHCIKTFSFPKALNKYRQKKRQILAREGEDIDS